MGFQRKEIIWIASDTYTNNRARYEMGGDHVKNLWHAAQIKPFNGGNRVA
jgi:hypothetical protein